MFSFLIQLLRFTNLENELFIQNHNNLNLSYTVSHNQFIDVNYTEEFNLQNENYYIPYEVNNPIKVITKATTPKLCVFCKGVETLYSKILSGSFFSVFPVSLLLTIFWLQ